MFVNPPARKFERNVSSSGSSVRYIYIFISRNHEGTRPVDAIINGRLFERKTKKNLAEKSRLKKRQKQLIIRPCLLSVGRDAMYKKTKKSPVPV